MTKKLKRQASCKDSQNWYVYIVECADSTLYAGITTNLERRIDEHNNDNALGSKYTRVRRPVKLVYSETFSSRSEASKVEVELKALSRDQKLLRVKNLK